MDNKDSKTRILLIANKLEELYPDAKIALNFSNNWELLVAVELSAQCTDKKVNEVTFKLFQKYKTFDDYLKADISEFEKDIKSTGFYHNKAKNILEAAKMLDSKYDREIPKTMSEIMKIPGVARKTANVVLGNAYGVVEGITVDTHVKRFAQKFELSKFSDPVKIERDLMEILPKEKWFKFPYQLINYGREICPGRVHDCATHPLSIIYPKAASIWPKT